jgi:hypothetical protein
MEMSDAIIISASGLSTSNETLSAFPAGSAAKVSACTMIIKQTKNILITDLNCIIFSFPIFYSFSVVYKIDNWTIHNLPAVPLS